MVFRRGQHDREGRNSMIPRSPLLFFWLVSPPKRYLVVSLAALLVGGVGMQVTGFDSADFALVCILIVQLLAASTGFTVHASRGFYDPILISGRSRFSLAGSHFLSSALPGILAWTGIGIVQAIRAGSLAVEAFQPEGWAAILLVSTIAWALTVRLPPLSGGVAWLLITAALAISGRAMSLMALAMEEVNLGEVQPLKVLAFSLVFPFFITGPRWPLAMLCGLFLIAALAFCAGTFLIRQAEVPLTEEGT